MLSGLGILLSVSQVFALSMDPVVLNSTSEWLIPVGCARGARTSGKNTDAMLESESAAQRHVV